jgi:serine/threonine protein kinase/thioredoxin-like negative regulator of GroEL
MANNYSFDPNTIGGSAQPHVQSHVVSEVSQSPSVSGGTPSTTGGSASLSGPYRLLAGTSLSGGRYTIEKLIAQGGMGAVYRANDIRFNRPCAVKEMLDEFRQESERAQAIEWFSREATLLLDLNHLCIPRVRDFFAENGRNYLVMDFIEGYTLAQMLEMDGNVKGLNGASGITEAHARSWMRQIVSVLSYLHGQTPPIIFRDLKPSNIMVTKRDEIKLIDFGIARTFQSQRQATVIMTIGYAPPEQMHGLPEPRSDIYALGATIHRLLTRHDPVNNKPTIFTFPSTRTLRPDISAAFDQIIMRALAMNIEQRWSSAEEMERAILNLPPISASPQSPVMGQGSGAGFPLQRPNTLPNLSPLLPAQTVPSSLSGPCTGPASAPVATHTTTGPAGPYLLRALAYLAANPPHLDAAHSEVMAAYKAEPNNALVHKIFGKIFVRRNPPDVDRAIEAYNHSLRLYSEDAETHKLVGDVLFYLRPNYVQAITAYSQSLRLSPHDLETHERLALCYERTNQLDAALREYQEAVRLASSQSQSQPQVRSTLLRLYSLLGFVARRLNHLSIAENAFVQILFLNPSDNQTRFLLCQVYEQEGKLEDAFRECGYVMNGPLAGSNPLVKLTFQRLKERLGR